MYSFPNVYFRCTITTKNRYIRTVLGVNGELDPMYGVVFVRVVTVLWAVFDVYRPTVLFGLPRWVVDFELVMVVIVFDTRGAI